MIIKILTRKTQSYKQLLEYICDKDRWQSKHKNSFVITHNLRGASIKQWVEQYKANDMHRQVKRRDSICLTHEILSWHKEDQKHLTLQKMEAMTREYIRKRNPNGMYIAIPHFDKDHFHIHMAVSGVEYKTGKSMRLPKANLQKLKRDVQEYQIANFPELTHSIENHGKGGKSMSDAEFRLKQRGKVTDKEKMQQILEKAFKKATSKEEFFRLLHKEGFETYIRGGLVYGIHFGAKRHRFKTLGFDTERLKELDERKTRSKELEMARRSQENSTRIRET